MVKLLPMQYWLPVEPQFGSGLGGGRIAQGVGAGTDISRVQMLVQPLASVMVKLNVQMLATAGGIQETHWRLVGPSIVPQFTDQLYEAIPAGPQKRSTIAFGEPAHLGVPKPEPLLTAQVGLGFTVTIVLQAELLPQSSNTVQIIVVVPTG